MHVLDQARTAQAAWAATPIAERLRVLRGVRLDIAERPERWAEAITPPQERTLAESLAAEVGPLADALRWLERRAERTLRPRREGRWPQPLRLTVERKPLGLVLVIGASNYPLFLLAVPAAQALAAGNAVALKPPPGGEAVAALFQRSLLQAGLDPLLCPVLDASVEAAQTAIDAGVDHVVFTGSAEVGELVAGRAAKMLTPCTMECSGSDAVIVLPGADTDRVAACAAWGLTFNSGATCIGPRTLICLPGSASRLCEAIVSRLSNSAAVPISPSAAGAVRRVLSSEINAGCKVHTPEALDLEAVERYCDACELPPVLFTPAGSARSVRQVNYHLSFESPAEPSNLARTDLFAPVLAIENSRTADEAIQRANQSPFALGASVFGPTAEAERVAARLDAGCVTVNDLIAPTADPRVPFGGARRSGYGVTRGPEGLLGMTRPQAIVTRRGRWLPHLDEANSVKPDVIAGLIQASHGPGLAARVRGVRRLLGAVKK